MDARLTVWAVNAALLLTLSCVAGTSVERRRGDTLPDDGTGGLAATEGPAPSMAVSPDGHDKMWDFLTYREYPNSNTARTLSVKHDMMVVCEDVFGSGPSFVEVEARSGASASSLDDGNTMSKQCYRRPIKKLSIVDPFKISFEPEAIYPETDQTKRRFEVAIQNPRKCAMANGIVCVRGVKEFLFITPHFFKQQQLGGLNTADPKFPRCAAKGDWEQKCEAQMRKISGF